MKIEKILLACFQKNKVYYSQHAKNEMINEDFGRIFEFEVYQAIEDGTIIEEYTDD